MILINKTKNEILTNDIKYLKTFSEKSKGFLSKDNKSAIYFKTRWGIHTFGMNFNIDCIITDKNLIVKKLKINLKPNNFFFWNPKIFNVIEIKSKILENNIEIGDRLEIK
jgi:hypothetical protein